MTTITVNEKTKAGKSFLEFAKNLPFVKLQETAGLGRPAVKTKSAELIKSEKRKKILALAKKLDAKTPIKTVISDAEINAECKIVRKKNYQNAN